MKIEWSTVVVVVVLVAALVVLAALRVQPETLTAIGALAVVVAGALKAMIGPEAKL
jgi:hypothetical protein